MVVERSGHKRTTECGAGEVRCKDLTAKGTTSGMSESAEDNFSLVGLLKWGCAKRW